MAGAADVLCQLNNTLMINNELRSKDAYDELKEYFTDINSRALDAVRARFESCADKLEEIVISEPLRGTNPKLLKLCELLEDLYENHADPRG